MSFLIGPLKIEMEPANWTLKNQDRPLKFSISDFYGVQKTPSFSIPSANPKKPSVWHDSTHKMASHYVVATIPH